MGMLQAQYFFRRYLFRISVHRISHHRNTGGNTTLFIVVFFILSSFAVSPVAHAQSYNKISFDSNTEELEVFVPAPRQHLVPEYEDGSVIVQYRDGIGPHGKYGHQAVGLSSTTIRPAPSAEERTQGDFWKLEIDDDLSIEEAIAELKQDPDVVSAEPNMIRRITAIPNDPEYTEQWHLSHPTGSINPEQGWDTQIGSESVVVAIIDTGVDTDHPDLAENMWENPSETPNNSTDDDGNGYVDDYNGYDFVKDNGDPNPDPDGKNEDGFGGKDNGVTHGTHVAGLIAAIGNNGVGITGVAWTSSIMALRVLDDEGVGTDADIVTGIEYAVDNGADIINMSLGGYGSTSILREAIEYAVDNGVLVVAAVGNDAVSVNQNPFYPSCYDGVLGVTSTSKDSSSSYFSNYGADCVDIAAPGDTMYSTVYTNDPQYEFTDDYEYMSGTSMAAPVVTGVVAVLKSEDDTLSRMNLIDIVKDTAQDIGLDKKYGSGRIDLSSALAGMSEVKYPTAPTTITAYSNAEKSATYEAGSRQNDRSPFFKWDAATDDGSVVGYYVYFGPNKNANPVTKGTFQTGLAYTPSSVTGNDQDYYLRIVAQDDDGNTSSDIASFQYVIDTTVPQPKSVAATRTANGVKISWEKVKNENVQQYKINRKVVGSAQRSRLIAIVNDSTTNYTDRKVFPNVKYRYRVRAIDDLQNTRWSKKEAVVFIPRDRLVFAPGVGARPLIRIYNTKTATYEYSWFAFSESETSGVEVAVGNLDSDKTDEIVVALDSGSEPRVKVFEVNGTETASFLAYDQGFHGGVRIAVGDIDHDGIGEIVTAPGVGGTPHVKLFEADGTAVGSFMALDKRFTGGSFVTVLDWNGREGDEIAVSAGEGGGPTVVVYKPTGETITSFEPYDTSTFRSGIRLTSADLDSPRREALVIVPEQSRAHIQVYVKGKDGAKQLQSGFFGTDEDIVGGDTIAAGDVSQIGFDRIILGTQHSPQSRVQVYTASGGLKETIEPYDSFTGSIRVGSGWMY